MQTMITMASNQMGKKDYSKVWTSYFSGLILLCGFALALLIPFFIFPQTFVNCFSGSPFYQQLATTFPQMSLWLWMAIIAFGLNGLSLGFIIAARDTLFLFWFYCSLWLISFIPIYFLMNGLEYPVSRFWLIVMGTNLIASVAFLWRASKEKWKGQEWQFQLPSSEIS